MAAKKKSSRKKTAAKKAVSKKKASPRKKSAAKKVAKKAAKKAVREKALRPRDEKEEEKGKVPELEVVVESAVEAAGGARVEQERQPEPIKEEPEPTY